MPAVMPNKKIPPQAPRAQRAPREAEPLNEEDCLPFNVENIAVVTGLGNGSTREIARPGIDAPPDPKDRLEVEIVGAGDTSRVTFDAKQLDEVLVGEQPNGLNRLISVLSEISGIPRAEMILTLYKDGVCDKEILKGSNPYKGSDVDAHLLEEFNWYLKTDAALQASDSDHDVWWASKRKELESDRADGNHGAQSLEKCWMATKNQHVDARALIADCRNLQKEATLHLTTRAYNDLSIGHLAALYSTPSPR